MSEDTTKRKGTPETPRRPSLTLEVAELAAAVELLTEIRLSQKAGLLLLIIEHVGERIAEGAVSAINEIRDQIIGSNADNREDRLSALRKETRDALTQAITDEG